MSAPGAGDGNLFADLAAAAGAERFDRLLAAPGLRLERIVSTGQASPPGFWYDQPAAEWVVVLAGSAALRFEDEAEARRLGPGDHLFIAARRRHRVEATDPQAATVWLALHVGVADDAMAGAAGSDPNDP